MLWLVWGLNQRLKFFTLYPRHIECKSKVLAHVPGRFDGFDNTVEPDQQGGLGLLVPNLVHFVRLGEENEEVKPEEAACISAALRTQPGSTVVVHTDREELRGMAWELLVYQAGRRLRLQRRPRPKHVFGLPFRDEAARHRVTALRVLAKHGGIYLGNTVYLRADLTPHRRFEAATASVASDADVVAAHRDARLLARWLHHFHDADLVWERRPATPSHLFHPIFGHPTPSALFVDVRGVKDPRTSAFISSDDWYLWAKGAPAPAA